MSMRAWLFGLMIAIGASSPSVADAKRLSREVQALEVQADAGDAQAQFALANAYDSGQGAPRDGELALRYYRLAAEQDHLEAMNSLGSALFAVERYDEARPWLEKAAARDHPLALTSLGHLHDLGLGGLPQDRRKGLELYTRAAERGDGAAMINIANQYGAGRFGEVDLMTACVWTIRAGGSPKPWHPGLLERFMDSMRYLESKLSKDDLKTCRARAADWSPAYLAAPSGDGAGDAPDD